MSDQYNSRMEKRKKQKKKRVDNKPAAKNKNNKRSLVKKVFITLAALFLLSLAIGAGTFAFMVRDAPKLDETLLRDPVSSKIYDMNGDFVTSIGSEKRDYVQYEDIPQLMKDAILATEDARFFEHHGVDIIRIGGAVVKNITEGFGSQGASTITQQVVKMSFLTPDKTLDRKAEEAWLAYQLEREYSKEEIFEMYVNKVFMSDRIFGIKAAANHYFGKELNELSLSEAALLAGMPQSPNNYNPFDHPERAEKRRNVVLSLMEQHDKISEAEMKEAQSVPVTNQLAEDNSEEEPSKTKFSSFIDVVVEEVEEMGEYNPYSDGLKIYTTLDPEAQTYMEKLLDTDEIIQYPSEDFQAGIALTDTQTGAIRAIGGGRNQEVQRGTNWAVDLKHRQPGSVIKPLIDYGPAIEYLKWSTYQQLDDRPYTYSNGAPIRNAGGSYMGPLSMRTALVYSRNIPALQTYQEVGHEKANEFLKNVGIEIPEAQAENESNAIGGMSGISPLDLAGAYAAFGNGGTYNKPHSVTKIVLSDGETEVKNDIKPQKAMNDYTAYMITDMLKDVLDEGTGVRANIPSLHVAGKTGTTNYTAEEKQKYNIPSSGSPDSWFVGYTTNYTAAIWTGYEERSEYLSRSSQNISKELFKNLMEEVSSGKETEDFEKPDSVVELPVIKGSNPARIAGDGVPNSQKVYELFIRGEEPKKAFRDFKEEEEKEQEEPEEQEEESEPETTGAIEGLSASYDASSQSINVSWSFSGEGSPSFTVSSSSGESQSTDGNAATFGGAQPGESYTFTVTALVDGAEVDSASTSLTVPGGEEEAPPEETEEPEEEPAPEEEPETPEEDGEEPNQPVGNTEGENNGGNQNNGGSNGGNNGGDQGQNNNGGSNSGGNSGTPNNGGGTPSENGGNQNNNGGGQGGTPNNGNGGGSPPPAETPASPPAGDSTQQGQGAPASPPAAGNEAANPETE